MSRDLKLGDTGDDVRALQTGLMSIGKLHAADGDFGPLTQAALRGFQLEQGLTTDGTANPATMKALSRAVPAEMPADPFEFHTAGPHAPDDTANAYFVNGWYQRARRVDAHPGRIGRVIAPRGECVHTTDMMPDSFPGLVKTWHEQPGSGAAAHFVFGRTPAQGVVQMISIFRNGNHAGGQKHGNFVTTGGTLWHPNLWLVGIEVHAGGRLGKRPFGGMWKHPDSKQIVPTDEVFVDDHGIGWHKPTDYQLAELELLLDALKPLLVSLPADTAIQPNGTYVENGVAPWAEPPRADLVGHVSLDPLNKNDPGPEIMAWLRAYAKR